MKAEAWGLLAAIVAVRGVWYALSCWWRPLKPCWCCKGQAVHMRKDGKVFRQCWVCRRSPGRRWRIGRRVWNFFRNRAHT